jgi:hypothetical protein
VIYLEVDTATLLWLGLGLLCCCRGDSLSFPHGTRAFVERRLDCSVATVVPEDTREVEEWTGTK